MPSIIPGYEYDIFISYRHNDNRSGWVTEFVSALQEELGATIKEPITIYFDKNPHDGLLETHNVDKSLEGKLKCLIFIPIISQTYCDPKSFAWQHEFVAFNKQSKQDQFGGDIKLANGNVASRILPIRIHELDQSDNSTIEIETGSVLRGLEFIYKEAGVNRPLRSAEDHPAKNQNQTTFRNQVNKVANGVKEIITAMRNPADRKIGKQNLPPGAPRSLKKPALALLVSLLLAAATFFVYRQQSMIHGQTTDPHKSIAVLPFVNMSNDPEQEYFSDGISEEILNVLAKVSELKVIGRTSSFYFKGKNEDLRIIGEKLGASYLLEGSVRKEGTVIRITAQLIKASDGTHLWSETFERKLENIFKLQDEIASNVLDQLKLTLLESPARKDIINQDVFNLILKGRYFVDGGNYSKGLDFYEQALALDSSEAIVWTSLAQARAIIGTSDFKQFEESFKLVRRYAKKALSIDETFSDAHRTLGMVYLFHDFDFKKARQEFNLALRLDPNNSDAYRNLGAMEGSLGNFDEALIALSKSVDLNPLNTLNLSNLAGVYTNQLRFKEAEQILIESRETSSLLESSSMERQLVGVYILSGKADQAQKLFDKTFAGWDPDDREITQALITYASGKKDDALEILSKSLINYHGNSFRVAEAFAFMDEGDEAFQWLSKAYDEKFRIFSIKRSTPFRKFHDDPRYIALLKKMNLPI